MAPEDTEWLPLALLRPGQEVTLVNLSAGGALLHSRSRMVPGSRADLQLLGPVRCHLRGRISRCRVLRLTPLYYEGAIVFDEPLDVFAKP